ncbi:MAG: cupin domain-containing protein [Caulobacteraceae bacterium]|nr:cupin domain-containing protein [Caulobacteraceae bacterium]
MIPAARRPFRDDLRARLIRNADLVPCRTAFIDSRTPGSDRKENFTLIGRGVSESPEQHVHITLPHGFNIGGARQPPHCVNSQHYHETAEAFFAHSGTWAVTTGERGDEGRAELPTGSLISVPAHVFRGFENIGEDVGFLYFMLGGDDPGRVTWAPDVLEKARDHGLILMETGRLIDTLAGQSMARDERPQAPTPRDELDRIVVHLDDTAMRQVVVSLEEARAFDSAVSAPGVVEAAMIGPANPAERAPAGKLDWRHGFVARSLSLEPRAASPRHRRAEPEVIFLHEGALFIEVEGESIELAPGDTFSVPTGAVRRFRAEGRRAVALVTRGSDHPAKAELDG